ncbi:MAG: tetratricopeptide repeat protein, partial [Tyzzerella sp.]|nr:tetratricopeptide repeat protein [Tyzzerella sp.]
MDKQEFRLKTEQMFQYMKEKSYKEALQIAESMEWKKVKNVAVLNAVSEVYEMNEEYQKSRDILFLAYDRAPESKKIIYRLGMLALKMGELKEAMDCYEEFMALAPKDPNG